LNYAALFFWERWVLTICRTFPAKDAAELLQYAFRKGLFANRPTTTPVPWLWGVLVGLDDAALKNSFWASAMQFNYLSPIEMGGGVLSSLPPEIWILLQYLPNDEVADRRATIVLEALRALYEAEALEFIAKWTFRIINPAVDTAVIATSLMKTAKLARSSRLPEYELRERVFRDLMKIRRPNNFITFQQGRPFLFPINRTMEPYQRVTCNQEEAFLTLTTYSKPIKPFERLCLYLNFYARLTPHHAYWIAAEYAQSAGLSYDFQAKWFWAILRLTPWFAIDRMKAFWKSVLDERFPVSPPPSGGGSSPPPPHDPHPTPSQPPHPPRVGRYVSGKIY
jgi:hypothetical protein